MLEIPIQNTKDKKATTMRRNGACNIFILLCHLFLEKEIKLFLEELKRVSDQANIEAIFYEHGILQ
jgi:hypothetical protein